LKLQKQQVVPHQTRIYSENPWRLQQVDDDSVVFITVGFRLLDDSSTEFYIEFLNCQRVTPVHQFWHGEILPVFFFATA